MNCEPVTTENSIRPKMTLEAAGMAEPLVQWLALFVNSRRRFELRIWFSAIR